MEDAYLLNAADLASRAVKLGLIAAAKETSKRDFIRNRLHDSDRPFQGRPLKGSPKRYRFETMQVADEWLQSIFRPVGLQEHAQEKMTKRIRLLLEIEQLASIEQLEGMRQSLNV